jgi:hypothetical protein
VTPTEALIAALHDAADVVGIDLELPDAPSGEDIERVVERLLAYPALREHVEHAVQAFLSRTPRRVRVREMGISISAPPEILADWRSQAPSGWAGADLIEMLDDAGVRQIGAGRIMLRRRVRREPEIEARAREKRRGVYVLERVRALGIYR